MGALILYLFRLLIVCTQLNWERFCVGRTPSETMFSDSDVDCYLTTVTADGIDPRVPAQSQFVQSVLPVGPETTTAVPPARWKEQHLSLHPVQGQLYYEPESCLKISRLVAHRGPVCRIRRSWQADKCNASPGSLHYCLNMLPAPNPNDTFGLICKAYTVIHLWCYGGKKRFMTHNKLLRSCMWWGNQGRKWAGNSLLHATLIHPSVRETSPLCTPHLKGP